jgi:hypothetical protein
MIGVTLSLGGYVAFAAVEQFGMATDAASLGTSLELSSSGVQLGFVYAAVAPSAACPVYAGHDEGTSLTVSFFDYGTSPFAPAEFYVNSTAYPGTYPILSPGGLVPYTIDVSTCAHSTGQTVLAVDAAGDEVQVGT